MHSAADSAYRHVAPALLAWKDGGDRHCAFDGRAIDLHDFGNGYRTTLSCCEELLAKITASIDTDLEGINIIDRLTDDRPGASFIDSTPELFAYRHSLINSFLSPELRTKWVVQQDQQLGTITWNRQAMSDFLSEGDQMQKYFLALLHTGGGESSRGPEFLMTLIRNLPSHPRDIHVMFNSIRHFKRYSKVMFCKNIILCK